MKRLESLSLQFKPEFLSLQFNPEVKDTIIRFNVNFFSQLTMLKNLHLHCCTLQLNNDFRLDKLETLELNYVFLEGIQWETFISAPTIKSIRLRYCNLPNKLCLRNNLEHLNLLTISGSPNLRKVDLNASNLKTFEYFGELNLECPIRAKLENLYVYSYKKPHSVLYMLRGLGDYSSALKHLKHLFLNVEINQLKLHTWPVGLFRSVLWLQLDLAIKFSEERDPGIDYPFFLHNLLRCFPMMRKLELTIPHYVWPYRFMEKNSVLPTSYLHTNLMEVELRNFEESWTYFGSFLLRSAIVLERLVITKSCTFILNWGIPSVFSRSYSFAERVRIRTALLGKALSPRANVIIR